MFNIARNMAEHSSCTTIKSSMPTVSVLCKGCRTMQPVELFLCPVFDTGCYRIRQQCWSCINKSAKQYRKHREDLRSTRHLLETQSERVTCACGISIRASYREQHDQTKRHQAVVALLRNNSTASTTAAKTSLMPSEPNGVPRIADVTLSAKDRADELIFASRQAGTLSALKLLEECSNSDTDTTTQCPLSPRARRAEAANIVFRLPHAIHVR